MKTPTVVLKTSKFDVPKVVPVASCCINYSRKLLPSTIGIDHFLNTRTIKQEIMLLQHLCNFERNIHSLHVVMHVFFF